MSHAHSVTFDNGKEFSEHKRITDVGIDTYFTDPYKSIQQAWNENTNGLIRDGSVNLNNSYKWYSAPQMML